MDDKNLKESSGSKALTSEQQQKLQELQRRRQQIRKAQDEGNKKSKKRKKNSSAIPPESRLGSGEQERIPSSQSATEGTEQWHRSDIGNHLFTPSEELAVFIERENRADNLQVEQEFEGNNPHIEAAAATAEQALVAKDAVGVGGGGDSATSARRKRKKLYWGLDSKERWERKSNM